MMQFTEALLGLYADQGQDTGAGSGQEQGQSLVEYALVLAFIAIAVIIALIFFGSKLTTLYSKLGNSIPN
jgi:Flp pilus assembly pilin Flp